MTYKPIYTITPTTITFVFAGIPFTVVASHENFKDIKHNLEINDLETAMAYLDEGKIYVECPRCSEGHIINENQIIECESCGNEFST